MMSPIARSKSAALAAEGDPAPRQSLQIVYVRQREHKAEELGSTDAPRVGFDAYIRETRI